MKLLLDTHLLLWAAGSPDQLPAAVHQLLENPLNELLFSAASLWEIVIKRGTRAFRFSGGCKGATSWTAGQRLSGIGNYQ